MTEDKTKAEREAEKILGINLSLSEAFDVNIGYHRARRMMKDVTALIAERDDAREQVANYLEQNEILNERNKDLQRQLDRIPKEYKQESEVFTMLEQLAGMCDEE